MEINPTGGKTLGAPVKLTPQSQPAQGLRQLGVFIHHFPPPLDENYGGVCVHPSVMSNSLQPHGL